MPRTRLLALALAVVCALPALLPGDAPFVNDEPKLMAMALSANAHHRLADVGLPGTHGVRYGPLPTWIYQAYLSVSHDLVALVALRAVAIVGATAIGLLMVAETLQVSPWLALVPLLSPYVWIYARELWDNTFCIPLGALAVGAYARFLARPTRVGLVTTLVAVTALPLIHLQTLSLVVPLGAHALYFARRGLWRYRWTLLACLVVGGLAATPYALILAGEHPVGASGAEFPMEGWAFPFLGARLFTGSGLDYFFGQDWAQLGGLPAWVNALSMVSLLAFVAAWAGMARAAIDLRQGVRSVRGQLLVLLLAVLVTHIILVRLTAALGHPHYYVATFGVTAAFLMLGFGWVRGKVAWVAPALQGGAALALMFFVIVRIHLQGGTRGDHYGPTLQTQLELARSLADVPPETRVFSRVENVAHFPHALGILRELLPSGTSTMPGTFTQAVIDYEKPAPDAHLVLRTM
jgi:hypothetical protein